MEEQGRSALGRYRSDLRKVVGSSASAYGYTLTIWSTGMVLSHTYEPPSPPLVFSFSERCLALRWWGLWRLEA